MKQVFKTMLKAGFAFATALQISAVQAAPIVMDFDFSAGFNLSLNGGAAAPSGALLFRIVADNTTPDLDPDPSRGRFAISSIVVSAAAFGIASQSVVAPSPLFVDTFSGGLTIIGAGFSPDIGWNGGPAPSSFMSDINDLSTLPLPTSVTMSSTFFLQSIGLGNGDSLSGTTGGGGPDGTFSARAQRGVVPEPTTLLLSALGLIALAGASRRKARQA